MVKENSPPTYLLMRFYGASIMCIKNKNKNSRTGTCNHLDKGARVYKGNKWLLHTKWLYCTLNKGTRITLGRESAVTPFDDSHSSERAVRVCFRRKG